MIKKINVTESEPKTLKLRKKIEKINKNEHYLT